jgi:hypothetical protein
MQWAWLDISLCSFERSLRFLAPGWSCLNRFRPSCCTRSIRFLEECHPLVSFRILADAPDLPQLRLKLVDTVEKFRQDTKVYILGALFTLL